jgi:branched-chain amino acid transport system permease protein
MKPQSTSAADASTRRPIHRATPSTSRRLRPLPMVAGLVVLVIVAVILSGGGFVSELVTQMLIFAIAAMGVGFLGGYGGLVSLGQASMLGLGAYGVAVAMNKGFGPWTAVAVSLGTTLLVALVAGLLAVRVRGIGFVIMTLAVGQILFGLSSSWVAVSGGDNGLIVPAAPALGGLDFNDPVTLSFAVLVVFVLTAAVLWTFVRSPFGLSLQGIKSNEQRLKTLGYTTRLHLYIGYVISVMCGGVAGVLFAFTNGLVTPTTLDFAHNGIVTLMAVIGGLGSLWGPAIGSVIVILFQQDLSLYMQRWATVMGVFFVLVVIFAPEGVWGVGRSLGRRLTHRSAPGAGHGITDSLPTGDLATEADMGPAVDNSLPEPTTERTAR